MVVLEAVDSTQDEIHRLAGAGAPAGTAVVARRQGQGRGSRGREWVSADGGMWLSVLWRGEATAAQLLSIRAGLVVAGVIEEQCDAPAVQLKWPNDVLIHDQKVGGILCEGRWQGDGAGWVAIGVGLNVNNEAPSDVGFPATTLKRSREDLDPLELADRLAPLLARLSGDAVLGGDELARWGARDWLRGRAVRAPVQGVASGITPLGWLIVTSSGTGERHELVAGDRLEL
jgi:biotin-[acetyl-CoA-carboxylase] ligase BirA-like protein